MNVTFQVKNTARFVGFPSLSLSLLSACGGGGGLETESSGSTAYSGLPSAYVPPASIYLTPRAADPFMFSLQSNLPDPYWVAALRSGGFDSLGDFIGGFDRQVEYAFPDIVPSYYQGTDLELDWSPASNAIRSAYLEIFELLEERFNVTFVPAQDIEDPNVVSVSQRDLMLNTAGFAYYLGTNDPISGDIFIDPDYSNPRVIGAATNFDYELLIHELGHALGLKHPFEGEGLNTVTLEVSEDSSAWTVMTYTHDPSKYNGDFRGFDIMALAELYGVRDTYKAGDDVYSFSPAGPVFVLDGAGFDIISASSLSASVTIDLREGAHSSVGVPTELVAQSNQLIISSGSKIEAASGGSGSDLIYGNDLDNVLLGGAGSDRIFAGEGADIVVGGTADDVIDLSELGVYRDILVYEVGATSEGTDTVYGFVQGFNGDTLEIAGLDVSSLEAVVGVTDVPSAEVFNIIMRLVGEGLETAAGLLAAFAENGKFEEIGFSDKGASLVITAESQDTGEDQCLFVVDQQNGILDIEQLAILRGNYLDIDSWHIANFVV